MVDYWLLANILTFALLVVIVFVWVKSFLTLVNAYISQVCYYTVSPHTDDNLRAAQQADSLLSTFIHIRDNMIFRVMFSTTLLLAIVFVRFMLGVIHAAV